MPAPVEPKSVLATLLALACMAAAPSALADPDKDESGHGRHRHAHGHDRDHDRGHGRGHGHGHAHGRSYKEEYRDGNCKIERKWEKNGDYKEERKCKGDDHRHRRNAERQPARQVVPTVVYPPWMVVEQGRPHRYRSGYEPVAAQQGQVNRCNSETVGRVLGGVAGAVLGNQVGGGSGRTLATVGGAVAGVLIGGEVGRRIDAGNQACIGQALELAPAGRRVEWPADGQRYAVVPGAAVQRSGTYCRPYEAQVYTANGWQSTHGTACRRSDGVWMQTR